MDHGKNNGRIKVYPYRDDENWLVWVLMRNNGGKMELSKKLVPREWWPDSSKSYKERYPRFRFPGESDYIKTKSM